MVTHRISPESICHANSSCIRIRIRIRIHIHNRTHTFIHYTAAHLPSAPLGNGISSPPSRRQVIVGVGEPVAAHFRVTFEPSRMTISVLVG